MLRKLLIASVLFCSAHALRATHIVGGEITYRCLGNSQDQYEITVQIFRDCYTGVPDFDTIMWVGVYDAQNKIVDTLLIDFTFLRDTLPIILSNPCLVKPPDVCVNTSTFRDTVSLPFSPGGYTIVYQRCCRNQLIRNIFNPLQTGASFVAEITEEALQLCNNGAVFKNWPPVAICIHQPIDWDHGAIDPDGDSLVYKLCTPRVGASPQQSQPMPPPPPPYDPVLWKPPYNLSNVLGGQPLTIDPQTGFLTGVPNTLGTFVVGICVEEYRNGQLISTLNRDFQYNVSDCGEPTAAFFAPKALCDKLTLKFDNQSLASNQFSWFFDVDNNLAATSNVKSPTYTFPDTGWYNVLLIAVGNNANDCRDSIFQKIHVTNSTIDAKFSLVYPDCGDAGLLLKPTDLTVDTVFGVVEWDWQMTFPGGAIEQYATMMPEFVLKTPGLHTLRLIVTSANGCTDTLIQRFGAPFPRLDSLMEELQICPGDSVYLNPQGDKTLLYEWSPPDHLDDATLSNPLAKPPGSIQYTVVATHPISGCTLQKTVSVNVIDTGQFAVAADPPKVFLGESSQLEAIFPGVADFVWQADPTLSATDIADPIATPTDTTEYFVTALLSGGCTLTRSILIPVIFPRCEEPYIFFPTGFSPNGDGENDVLKAEGFFIESIEWVVYDRWGERIFTGKSLDDAWDGTHKGKPMPAETYGYFIRVLCPNGQTWQKKGNITLLR